MTRRGVVLFLVPLVAACELTEVTVPPGEPIVIVQAVLSRSRPTQFVIVEESLTGSRARGGTGPVVPPAEPRIPVTGARVLFTHDGPSNCDVPTVTLDPLADTSGVYTTDAFCSLEPGDRVVLRVETPGGVVVTGQTTIPGAASMTIDTGRDTAAFEFQELAFHRERDTLRIGATPILARGMQVEVREADAQDEIAVFLFTDTLGVTLAGNLVNPFENDSGETVFRAGRSYLLTVAVTDTNYYDFLRSRSDPFTGRGFINHLQGGRGVFGSVEARTWVLRVVADVDDPREGIYRIQGSFGGVDTDITAELYLDDLAPNEFSAFLDGVWVDGTLRRSGDGLVRGDDIELFFEVPLPGQTVPARYALRGTRAPDGRPFSMNVIGESPLGGGTTLTGTLTARQTAGPP